MTSQGSYQKMNLEELKALPYPFARVCLFLYDVDTKTQEEIYRYRGEAITIGQLCQLIDALPENAVAFELHFQVNNHIIGNASYRTNHWIVDPATGKRESLYDIQEYGECQGFWRYFAELYQSVVVEAEQEQA